MANIESSSQHQHMVSVSTLNTQVIKNILFNSLKGQMSATIRKLNLENLKDSSLNVSTRTENNLLYLESNEKQNHLNETNG